VIALIVLVIYSTRTGDINRIVSSIIYGSSLVILYTFSTLYHSATNKKVKYALEVLDHSSIYLLISGTYTPFTMVTLKGTLGTVLLAIVWCLAIAGVVFKIFFVRKFMITSTLLYIAMGWIALIAIVPLYRELPYKGFQLLLLGGILYTLGTIFYIWRKVPFHHAIWHIIVLLGSITHFLSILLYVIMV